MKTKRPNIFLLLALFACLALILFGYLEIQHYKSDLADKESDLESTNAALNEKQQEAGFLAEKLDAASLEIAGLNERINESSKQLAQVSEKYVSTKQDINQTISDIEAFQKKIEESMAWFKTNSELGAETSSALNWEVKLDVITQGLHMCYESDGAICRIKTGCFELVNSKVVKMSYITDIVSTNQKDRLISLNEFINNKGGDCEDYSLFVKAEWNYVLQKCNDSGATQFMLESPKYELDVGATYYADFEDRWFLQDTPTQIISDGSIYPNVICGQLDDSKSGHCELAITKQKINSLYSLSELNDAPIIEPQGGYYDGKIGIRASGIVLPTYYEKSMPSEYIYQVITDSDLYLLSETGWRSYSSFEADLNTAKEQLLELLKRN
jgi:hypothetical protein